MPKVAIATLGCKVNQYDSDALAQSFRQAGFDVVGFDDEADVYIVNTCTVTQTGDKKSRQLFAGSSAPTLTLWWWLQDATRSPTPKGSRPSRAWRWYLDPATGRP